VVNMTPFFEFSFVKKEGVFMGDDSDVFTRISFLLILIVFLFRYILNKVIKNNEKRKKLTNGDIIQDKFVIASLNDIYEKEKFYSFLLNIIAVFSIFLVIVLIVKLLSIWKRLFLTAFFFAFYLFLYIV